MLKRTLQRLVRVYTCQNVKLLEISCRGSIISLLYYNMHRIVFNFHEQHEFELRVQRIKMMDKAATH